VCRVEPRDWLARVRGKGVQCDASAQTARLLPQGEQGESRTWARAEAVLAAQVVQCSKLLRAHAQHFFGTPELLQNFLAHSFRGDLSLREEIETNIEARAASCSRSRTGC
jgi:hypothetical protein